MPVPTSLRRIGNRKALLACALIATAARAQVTDTAATLDRMQKSEVGVSLSGKARAGYAQSALSGASAAKEQPTREHVAFTQADIDLDARPSAYTRGKLIFRVHQDWENYYDEGPNPLLARWFDFDGTISDGKVDFAVGDFREKYSSLTLYAAEPDFLYEPEIFLEKRRLAMDEFFLGDNRLPLQGAHVSYKQDWPSAFGLEATGTAARLRSGAGGTATWPFWNDDAEKILAGGFVKGKALEALEIGATFLRISDDINASRAGTNFFVKLVPGNVYENVNVAAVDLGFDAARYLKNGPFSARLGGEMAFSDYQRTHDDTAHSAPILVEDEKLSGKAMKIDVSAGWFKPGAVLSGLSLDAYFLNNDENYVNDAAQSSTFIPTRIYNSKNSGAGYNTFDALYDHTYAVEPITNINTSEFWFQDTKNYNGTNNWYRAAFFKNAYTNQTMTKVERDAFLASRDPSVENMLPLGPATPNRQGVNLSVTAKLLGKGVEAKLLFGSMKEPQGALIDSVHRAAAATYGRVGGGLKVEAGSLLKLKNRVTVSGSYVSDTWKRAAFTVDTAAHAAVDFKSAMINAGLFAGITGNFAVTGGYQQMTVSNAGFGDVVQKNWAAGIELKLAHGAYVTAQYGMMSFEDAVAENAFSQAITDLGLVVAF